MSIGDSKIEQRGEKGEKNRWRRFYRSVMVEGKSMVAHIHEWEENRAKGKREEERVWESGDGGGEYWIAEGEDQRDTREKEE